MERLMRNGDHSLLGHAPRDPFATPDALSGGLPRRNSDLNFQDVFGGPPRRRSERHSLGESVDTYASRGRGGRGGGGGEEAVESRRPWSSLGETPVFGASASPARRKLLGDDFFSDIFRGNESACSTPRIPDRDIFSSTPSSRVLSPTRPLPPRSELFAGSSSLPARLSSKLSSLSAKLTKRVDQPAISSPTTLRTLYKNEESVPDVFSFPSSPTTYVPAVPSPVVRARDDLRSDVHASYHQSPLSRQISYSREPIEATISASHQGDAEEQFTKDSTGSKAYDSSSHFHFSIYKWASKGVTLVMTSNSKERTKNGSRLSGLSLSSDNEKMPNKNKDFQSQSEIPQTSPSNDVTRVENDDANLTKKVDEVLLATLQSKSLPSEISKLSGAGIDTNERVPVSVQEASKPEPKTLRHMLKDDSDGQENEDRIGHAEANKSLLKGSIVREVVDENAKVKHRTTKNTITSNAEIAGLGSQDAPVTVEDKMPGSRVKGKVKEFIKIFNQEVSPKSSSTAETRRRRSKVKDEIICKVEGQANAPIAKADKEKKIDQILERVEKPASDKSSDAQRIYDSFSERNETSVPYSDSTLESFDASFGNIEESHFEDLEKCLVEEIIEDRELLGADLQKEEIQISDAKIREWSKGKEGNIRSLLSTLQYVLWPGSGWKPVPLVDIIEGASVKRTYQKALLCLHPDKLQQKGAAVHQKYIGEKIFDILQDAWTHFSSVSAL